ncbi:hypothetical protein AJ80_00121 [Polytolypa hystricis UAMH7299]|uniref:DUF3074 domain-containing protein n=1 Tax=Polytolypa hystricis (strain UAMH7299) TaxID=1447883 RepID=A0A2B7Z498_POLH7|nr:hypothetical protein AJ80_00121 [Polytolypa hystricis UAMH7299]
MTAIRNIAFVAAFLLGWLIWKGMKSTKHNHTTKSAERDPEKMDPYPPGQIKGKPKYCVTMGLKKLDKQNWLTIDGAYTEQHELRDGLFRDQRRKVLTCLPSAAAACEEAMQEVVAFLCGQYPTMFQKETGSGGEMIKNMKTGEAFAMGDSKQMEPLEIAARLAMEDLSVLLPNDDGEYYMSATASLFPIGWAAEDRVGSSISEMHAPVPLWHKQVGKAVNKFMGRLTADTPMERSSYFVQVTAPEEPLSSILFQPDGLAHENLEPNVEQIVIRRERQTFSKLPKSGGILFTVKTSLTWVNELPLEDLENLVTEVKSWPDEVARYKGRDHWGGRLLAFAEAKLQQCKR